MITANRSSLLVRSLIAVGLLLSLLVITGCGSSEQDDQATAADLRQEKASTKRQQVRDAEREVTATEKKRLAAAVNYLAGIDQQLIPFPAKRKQEMAGYSDRHYGQKEWRLKNPKVIVEHFAVAPTNESIYNTFYGDTADPELGELPNVCSHFAVDDAGQIIQMVKLNTRCRHTVGLNYTSIGIEHVGYSDQDVIGNPAELKASLKLTHNLMCRYGIKTKNVIGHNESLSSPFHKENDPALQQQTHGDMTKATMDVYRAKLRKLGPC